jgi:hypothetical protein
VLQARLFDNEKNKQTESNRIGFFQAVRSNGEILGNDISNGVIYLIDPQKNPAEVTIIAEFPPGTSLTGIAELRPDVFYVQSIDGNVYNFTFTPGSAKLWEVDLRNQDQDRSSAVVTKIMDLPESKTPNGLTVVPPFGHRQNTGESTLLLSADSAGGVVHLIDVANRSYKIVLDDPLLKPNATARPPFGVNGIHVVPGGAGLDTSTLYFANTNFGYFGSVLISNRDGTPQAALKLISDGVPAADDFAIDEDGSFWVAQNVRNTLSHVLPDGTVEFVAGGVSSSDLLGPVAAAFGRTREDRANGVLYVATDGLQYEPGTGRVLRTAGKIAKISTKSGSEHGWRNW